ncbi:MAG: Polar-differentiation response regulator DivK [Chloroflexi bacterium]|nr:Polar-differentiation response regulator DivK [Chloroflexota bacterium]
MNDHITIAIVEDEPDTAEMFAEMMRIEGYDVLKSYSGGLAKELIADNMPDVVVLDIMMPDLSGLDVLKWMHGQETLKNIPVVVVSARSLPADKEAGLKAGATVYLTKPVAYQDLIDAVSKVLSLEEK